MDGVRRFHQTFKGVHGTKKFKSPCVRRIPDRERNHVFPARRSCANPSTAMFSDGRIKATTNKTKQSIPVFWRGAVSLNVAFSVGHQCLTVPLQNVMFQFTGWRVNCHRLMLNFAYSCLDHYREQLLTTVGAYEFAKQDSWIAFFFLQCFQC